MPEVEGGAVVGSAVVEAHALQCAGQNEATISVHDDDDEPTTVVQSVGSCTPSQFGAVGPTVGATVGTLVVGIDVGVSVGNLVGKLVGNRVGSDEGDADGTVVGCAVGDKVPHPG